ncbi:hypothetical protein RZS08_17615, partial [Arthrospira platensis SPKY1]|nr:hypothetical protein [Arthrospira platensis SPKY1]
EDRGTVEQAVGHRRNAVVEVGGTRRIERRGLQAMSAAVCRPGFPDQALKDADEDLSSTIALARRHGFVYETPDAVIALVGEQRQGLRRRLRQRAAQGGVVVAEAARCEALRQRCVLCRIKEDVADGEPGVDAAVFV